MSPLDEPKLTLSEAADLLHVSYETVRRWIEKGALPHVRVGPEKTIRVYRRDVEALVDDQT